MSERRVQDFDLGLHLTAREDVERAEVQDAIKGFLHRFYESLAEILTGEKPDWAMPPDIYFIRAFESHIGWLVKITADFLAQESRDNRKFDARLQEWMAGQGWSIIRNVPAEWGNLLDRAARTLCYVFSNRLIFYESVRAKFEELKPLSVPKKAGSRRELYEHFQKVFQRAIEATGDYETIFYPLAEDWAGSLIFEHAEATDAWRSVLENLEPFNFKEIRTDILGGIFKRPIAPEERHKFGQHYTNEDLVDVVNAFCIRKADDNVLDPARGSGSFLVRAYLRKAWMRPGEAHQDRIAQIFGCDIALFAAHLATLNLAARDVRDEENYPRIARRNFFELRADQPFCRLPTGLRGERDDENSRQRAAESFRDPIARTKENRVTDNYRMVVRKQADLWAEGLRAGRLFALQKQRDAGADVGGEDEDDDNAGGFGDISATGYGGGKWGKYLPAPDLYFRIMEKCGNRFVPPGEIADIRFGVKSGCDAFFMPRDVTAEILEQYDAKHWNNAPLKSHCARSEVTSGAVRLVKDGNGVVHPVESEYLAPEVHSLMNVKRPVITADELDRLILLVSRPMSDLRGTHVYKHLRYGERATFASKKSKAVPIPERSTCAGRKTWYDLTYTKRGHPIWSKGQQYRHAVVYNSHNLPANCRLYDVSYDRGDCQFHASGPLQDFLWSLHGHGGWV